MTLSYRVSYRIALSGLLALLLSPSALSQVNDPALIAAAKKEGTGMLYTGAPPATADGLIRAFKEQFGIELQSQRANSGPLAVRFEAE